MCIWQLIIKETCLYLPPNATIRLPQNTNNHKIFKNLLKGPIYRGKKKSHLKIAGVQDRSNKKYNWHLYLKVRFKI